MSKLDWPKVNWIILAVLLSGSEVAALMAFVPGQAAERHDRLAPSEVLDRSQLAQRRPRERPGARDGGICPVSPGLTEDENIVLSDRPLFLWRTNTDGIVLLRLSVIDQSNRILWEKPLSATDQAAVYAGQALQPGQFYQWRLEWTAEGVEDSADYTFQLMSPDRRQPLAAELQAMSDQMQASGASAEAIAQQQADYLANQEKPLWSDALKLLYAVENPSMATTQRIQTLMNDVCGGKEGT